MLPELITDREEIYQNQSRLENELKSQSEHLRVPYATRGRTKDEGDLDVYFFEQYQMFWNSGDPSGQNRYWNGFGLGKPTGVVKHAFQVNIPKEGVNRTVRGGFLKRGFEVFLLHRGPLGGGRKDGSHDLRDIAPGNVQEFDDEGRQSTGIVIRFVDSRGDFDANFLPRIKSAVTAVAEMLDRE
jgi:hypothetical protein